MKNSVFWPETQRYFYMFLAVFLDILRSYFIAMVLVLLLPGCKINFSQFLLMYGKCAPEDVILPLVEVTDL